MIMRRNSKPEETMTVPSVSSSVEKTSESPSSVAKSEDLSEIYAHRPAQPLQSKNEGRLVIGEGVIIKGEIRECREIEIHGTVEGDLEAAVLIVHDKGLVKGNVSTDSAEIHGSIDGDVSVKNRLDVKAKGSVAGKTEYGELSVEAGGRVVGTLDEQSAKKERPVVTATPKPATNPALTTSKPAPANPNGSAPALN